MMCSAPVNNHKTIVSVGAGGAALRLILLFIVMSQFSCGQSGPLFLPKEPAPIKARVEPVKADGKDDAKAAAKPDPKPDATNSTDPGRR